MALPPYSPRRLRLEKGASALLLAMSLYCGGIKAFSKWVMFSLNLSTICKSAYYS
jgi:hypothetical protein